MARRKPHAVLRRWRHHADGPAVPPGRTAGRSVRREEYLEAIIAAIRRVGPRPTLAELADGAGMSKPVLYDHFTDRLGLTAAVVGKLTETVAADAAAGGALRRGAGGDARQGLRRVRGLRRT